MGRSDDYKEKYISVKFTEVDLILRNNSKMDYC